MPKEILVVLSIHRSQVPSQSSRLEKSHVIQFTDPFREGGSATQITAMGPLRRRARSPRRNRFPQFSLVTRAG
jgi:hypothetical protein